MLNPELLSKQNCHLLKKYYQYMGKHKALTHPTTLCMWKDFIGLEICECHGFLFMFESKFNYNAYPPYGEGDKEKALEQIIEYQKSKNTKPTLVGLTEVEKEYYEKLGYKIEEDDAHHEYVYLSENLANLKGKKYQKKRNHINGFNKQYEYEYIKMTTNHLDEIDNFIDQWFDENSENATEELMHEKDALHNFITFIDKIDYTGAMLKVDGKIVAITAGEQICDDMAVVYFEKALADFRNAYPVINKEFIAHEFTDVLYINRQEDLGIEGLRKAKRSYYPEFLVKNYSAHLY